MKFPGANTILELLILLTWKCLCQPQNQNSLFKQVFFDREALEEAFSDAPLFFCDGLFEALQGDAPPDPSFFETLPGNCTGFWALYFLTLKKPGFKTLIYDGTGTESKEGARKRWVHYEKPWIYEKMLPSHVAKALNDGYVIDHKGMMVWAPIPRPRNVAKLRLLFQALEATLGFSFWSMAPKRGNYGYANCCLWPLEAFTYGGLCSHSALNDVIVGDFQSTGDQIEAMVAEANELAKEKRRLANQYNYKKEREENLEGYKARKRRYGATYREKSADKKRVNQSRWQAKSRNERRHFCETCGVVCNNMWELKRHNSSRRHKLAVKRAANGKLRFHCDLCHKHFTHQCHLERHNQGKRHLQKVAEARDASGAVSEDETEPCTCDVCELDFPNEHELERHNRTRAHKKALIQSGVAFNFHCEVCDTFYQEIKVFNKHKKSKSHQQKLAEAQAASVAASDIDPAVDSDVESDAWSDVEFEDDASSASSTS